MTPHKAVFYNNYWR